MSNAPNSFFALIVDDDPLILMNASDILEEVGFRSLEASDVDQAIGVLQEHANDITLLFTDVHMPGDRNGFDLARETSSRWPSIKIMVASGAAKPAAGDMPEGAVFVSKPFEAEAIYTRLQEILPDGEKPEPLKRKAGF